MARGRSQDTRWDEDNRIVANPGAFIAVAVLGAALAGLIVLFALVL